MAHAFLRSPGRVSESVLRVLAVATAARSAGFAIDASAGWAAAIERLAGETSFDAVVVDGDLAPASPSDIAAVAERAALVVAVLEPDAEHACGRLRAGVRASDVVAAVGGETFAVLLGSILGSDDAERVAVKLVAAIAAPFTIAAVERSVAVAVGIAHYPNDGREAERLLRRALALAAVAPATSAGGLATVRDADGGARAAANDQR